MKYETSRRNFLMAGLALPAALESTAKLNPLAQGTESSIEFTYRDLGKTGLKPTSVGFGCMITSDQSVVEKAADIGINFFDTANTYGNRPAFDRPGLPSHTERKSGEELLGTALRGKRQDVTVASKVGEKRYDGENGRGLSRQHIMRAIDDTLLRLQTDYIDLYYSHWPDPNTPLEETLQAMGDLVRLGQHPGLPGR